MKLLVSARELHLKTSAVLEKVVAGDVVVIQKRGVPVAELHPVGAKHASPGFPDIERIIARLPKVRTDSGRILEEDRT